MKKRVIIIISILIIAIIGLVWFLGTRSEGTTGTTDEGNTIDTADAIYPASEETGWIGEKIIGDPDEASVVLYEYADYGCSHCADWNKTINDLIKEHEGKIAVVFRGYDLGFQNGAMAAKAATAAQIQGYFKEYKDLLFNYQTEWFYENKSDAEELFVQYFNRVTDGTGDIEKFEEDMRSDAVRKRLEFEEEMGKKVKLRGTPLFRINGKTISSGNLVKTIEEML